MTIVAWLVVSCVILVSALFSVWSRRPSHARVISVLLAIPSLAIAALAIASALGKPVPYVVGVTVPAGEHTVLGYKLVENVAIYVLVDGSPPTYVVLPWSTGEAQALQDAGERGRRTGRRARMRAMPGLFDRMHGKPVVKFYDPPQRAPAPKPSRPGSAPLTIPD